MNTTEDGGQNGAGFGTSSAQRLNKQKIVDTIHWIWNKRMKELRGRGVDISKISYRISTTQMGYFVCKP